MKARRYLATLAVGIAPLLALGAGGAAADAPTPTGTPAPTAVATLPARHDHPYAVGLPAIKPTRRLPAASSDAYHRAAGYGDAEVLAYFAHDPLFVPAAPGAGKVRRILFATGAEVSRLLGGWGDRPADWLVCYVEVQGPLAVPELHLPPRFKMKGPFKNPSMGIAVFDGQTGNLLTRGWR